MAKKTVYLKDEDEQTIEQLQEYFPGEPLSEIVRKALKAKLEEVQGGEDLTTEQKLAFLVEQSDFTEEELKAKPEAYIEGAYNQAKKMQGLEDRIEDVQEAQENSMLKEKYDKAVHQYNGK